MAMANRDYWAERFRQLEESQHRSSERLVESIQQEMRRAEAEIEKKIDAWYGRLAANNGISMTEARKLLNAKELEEFHWDVETYIKYGEENSINQQWMKQLENASARVHISRLEQLKLQVQQEAERLYGNYLDGVDRHVKSLYEQGFYKTAYEIQKGIGVGWNLTGVDSNRLDKLIRKPWAANGKNFSERIWSSKQQLIENVHTSLTQMCILGQAPNRTIASLAKFMGTSRSQAGRLIMTESAFFSSESRHDCFQELGVERYEIVATLDSHTSEICQEMDGKMFPMSEYASGSTAPPFHVWYRTTTVPAFGDEFDKIGQRTARDKDGKTYYVPADMTYPEWKKAMVDGDKSGLQEASSDGTIKKKPELKELDKLKQSGMSETEYQGYLNIISGHSNEDVIRLYSEYADKVNKVSLTANGGVYQPASITLNFTYPKYDEMNKYGTLAHEYGHFFDDKAEFDGLHFKEIDAVRKATGLDAIFKRKASSSDEFIAAMRSDKVHIKSILTADAKADLIAHNASSGVQDAIDGLFTKSRLRWGHGEKYYNRKYAAVDSMDKIRKGSLKKNLKQVYNDLGLDASNQSKTKSICRQYEAASEAWANIMSAEVCGGESLVYVKKYLPNSYQAMLNILKGVKVSE